MTTMYFDVKYGNHERNYVDICIPEKIKNTKGLIFYVHGGGFTMGDKECYTPEMKKVAQAGFICASTNYRYVAPDVSSYDVLDDITASLKKVKEFVADKTGISLEKMLITGGSAGAHITLQYAYSRFEEAPIKPAAAVSYSASTDVANTDMILDTALGNPDNMAKLFSNLADYKIDLNNFDDALPALRKTSPLYYVTKDSVPTVIVHGAIDNCVPLKNAEVLDAKLEECGVDHKFLLLPNSDHGLGGDPEMMREAFNTMLEYAEKYLK